MRKREKEKIRKNASREEATSVEMVSGELLGTVEYTRKSLEELYTEMAEEDNPEAYREEVERKLASYKRANRNISRAYYRSVAMSDELSTRWGELGGKRKKHFWRAPSNSTIDLYERRSDHFAKGMNLYKILLVLYIGSLIGVLFEMFWCLITNGYIESRAGLVLGPFNLLYGIGAVAMTLTLYRFRNHGKWLSFLGGLLAGSVVEYLCSFFQELLFGSVSWDYSHMPFNLNGRICLFYSVLWGVLGVLWVKSIYPRLAKLILRIPNRAGKIVTWALLAFFAVNLVLSALAVLRWSQRVQALPPSNWLMEWIDKLFPDGVMEKIYANMHFR